MAANNDSKVLELCNFYDILALYLISFILDSDLVKIAFLESSQSKESISESRLHRLCRIFVCEIRLVAEKGLVDILKVYNN